MPLKIVGYKLFDCTSLERLQFSVNEWLKANPDVPFEFLGGPQVMHHESFVQAMLIKEQVYS